MPNGSAMAMRDGHFAQQQRRDLGAGEAEHAQAGQLPGALGQRDARVVVDHADRDDAGKQGQDGAHDADVARADLLHVAQQRRLAEGAGHARQSRAWRRADRPRARVRRASANCVDRSPSPSSAVQRAALHVGVQAHHLAARWRATGTSSVRWLAFQHLDAHACRPCAASSLSASRSVSTRPSPARQLLRGCRRRRCGAARARRRSRGSGRARCGGR